MTDCTPQWLICVYYRVATGDSGAVIAAMREFQRTLGPSSGVEAAELLLRCDLSLASIASPPDAPAPSRHPVPAPAVDTDADATVMETYRLRLPAAAGSGAETALRAFLATLDAVSRPHAGLLRGARHVELFAPCAS